MCVHACVRAFLCVCLCVHVFLCAFVHVCARACRLSHCSLDDLLPEGHVRDRAALEKLPWPRLNASAQQADELVVKIDTSGVLRHHAVVPSVFHELLRSSGIPLKKWWVYGVGDALCPGGQAGGGLCWH